MRKLIHEENWYARRDERFSYNGVFCLGVCDDTQDGNLFLPVFQIDLDFFPNMSQADR